MSGDRTHGGVYPDVERVDMVIKQMTVLGFGSNYVEAVQAARDALARETTEREPE